MRLQFTRSANRDLVRLHDFIAQHDPRAATKVSARIARTFRTLRDQPGLGQALDEVPEVREFVIGDYVVRYTTRDDCVVILRIWHGREARWREWGSWRHPFTGAPDREQARVEHKPFTYSEERGAGHEIKQFS